MNEPYLLKRRLLAWGLVVGLWTLLGVIDATQIYLQSQLTGVHTDWWNALIIGLIDWYVLAALTPLIYFLARHFRFEPRQRARDIVLHIVVSCLCALVVLGVS